MDHTLIETIAGRVAREIGGTHYSSEPMSELSGAREAARAWLARQPLRS